MEDAIIIGISLIVAGQGLLAYGEQYLSSDITALLFSTVPIWVLLIGKFYYHLKLSKYTLLGIIAGLIGLVILIYPSFEDMLFGVKLTPLLILIRKITFLVYLFC